MPADPLLLEAICKFGELFARAETLGLREPAAVALATADRNGRPSVRTVLLRAFDERGFVFYTNSTSRKGRHLTANPQAALCFHWDALAEQFRAEGGVELVSTEENDEYWRGRPRERQLAAWASDQSQRLETPELLMQRYSECEQRFAGREIPRPDHWFGYRIVPDLLEFWSNRPARLHERIVYERQPAGWVRYLLYP
jgi:pyridoxamine 5'-phosphate oxidase